MSGLLLLATGLALLMSPKGRNVSRDVLVQSGWVVYSLLFPGIFILINCKCPLRPYAALPIRCKVYKQFFKDFAE